jgi:hypothetical protein
VDTSAWCADGTGQLLVKLAVGFTVNGALVIVFTVLRCWSKLAFDEEFVKTYVSWFADKRPLSIAGTIFDLLGVATLIVGLVLLGTKFGAMLLMVGVQLLVAGLLMRVRTWGLDANRPAHKTFRWLAHPGFLSGTWCCVMGLIVLSAGWACLSGSMPETVDHCGPTGLALLILGGSLMLFGVLLCLGTWYWNKMSPIKRSAIQKRCAKMFGPCMIIFKTDAVKIPCLILDIAGVVLISVGGACLNDTLIGVEDCKDSGTAMLIMGPSFIFVGVGEPMHPSYSYEHVIR